MPKSIKNINADIVKNILSWTKDGTILWHFNNKHVLASAVYSNFLKTQYFLIELCLDTRGYKIKIKDILFQRIIKEIPYPRTDDRNDIFNIISKTHKNKTIVSYITSTPTKSKMLKTFLGYVDPNIQCH